MKFTLPPSAGSLPPNLRRAGRNAAMIGLAALVLSFVAWIIDAARSQNTLGFYRAWLFAWLVCLGLSLGAMAAVMVYHLTGGEWGHLIRRFGEAAGLVLPLLFILFLPVLFGLKHLYPWADPANTSAAVLHKLGYLNPGFFSVRYIIYFVVWITLARLLRSVSANREKMRSPSIGITPGTVSAVGLVAYFVTMSLAAVDWIMSMDPQWYSTVFGFIVCMGQAVTGMAMLIIMLQLMAQTPPFVGRLRPRHFNDLATLLVTAVILWAYNSFSQLLIIWMGNIQHEITWYIQRNQGPWRFISMLLCLLGFLAPFVLLLQRAVKQRGRAMLWVCVGLLAMRVLDNYWMIAPGGIEPYPRFQWLNALTSVLTLTAIGGLWIATFLWLVDRQPVAPIDLPLVQDMSSAADNMPDSRTADHGIQPG